MSIFTYQLSRFPLPIGFFELLIICKYLPKKSIIKKRKIMFVITVHSNFIRWRNFYLRSSFNIYLLFYLFWTTHFYFDNEYIIRKGYESGFWKTSNYSFRCKCQYYYIPFQTKTLETIDHLKGISHKRQT